MLEQYDETGIVRCTKRYCDISLIRGCNFSAPGVDPPKPKVFTMAKHSTSLRISADAQNRPMNRDLCTALTEKNPGAKGIRVCPRSNGFSRVRTAMRVLIGSKKILSALAHQTSKVQVVSFRSSLFFFLSTFFSSRHV